MATVRVGGVRVVYERAGQGAPLVLVHGAGDDGRVWGPQVSALRTDFTVVAWDEPGAGRSSDLTPGFGLGDYADCLAAVISDAGCGPAHVVGLSWGGTVALELYRRRPDTVRTLVLADTYAGWKGSLAPQEVAARVAGVRSAPRGAGVPTAGLFAGEPPAAHVPLLDAMARAVRPDTLAAQLAIMAGADLRDVLPTIAVPTLLLWGERDARSPLGVARAFRDAVPGAELVVLPGAGHLSNLEAPEGFDAAVRGFCRTR
ncbi:alpha/beta fold hydrolase [Streptomyces sp. NPDC090106]|uniref:alpha/beta fold hydrolase n=1 Tax=Streptomyces sp. NPDC090106 TaxID=3365946 RepID=UPI0037F60A11